MPVISMFYGIVVAIFYEDQDRHHRAPIHARYQGHKAAVAIDDGSVLAGELPPKQLRLLQAGIELHRDELMADWELVCQGVEPFRIPPLQ
ncbi:hypothetical protein Tsedi_00665 [Tepidimonas sediminis]|uniref:DUF4160 domain-containing protein n=1 Tax=Tepidimonas sediminis TaxID=2588941 RepID=A0A554WS14_9BURK|nr:DUF4160 domain-containing protein [Tepidimonas sediminis]TSE26367.1 hypothetical protein Tsedi_00665 [Tepidimonas sediminis]